MKKIFYISILTAIFLACKPTSPLEIKETKPTVFSGAHTSFDFFKSDKYLKQSKQDKTTYIGEAILSNKKIKAIYTNFYDVKFGKTIDSELKYTSVELFHKEGQIARKYMSFLLSDTSIQKINPKKTDVKSDISFTNFMSQSEKRRNTYTSILPYRKNLRTAYFYDKNKRIEFIDFEIKPSIKLKDQQNYAYNVLMFDHKLAKKGYVNVFLHQFKFPYNEFTTPIKYDSIKNRITEDIGVELYPEPFNTNQLLILDNKTNGSYYRQYITYYN